MKFEHYITSPLDEASYEGNIGFEELVVFYQKSTDAEKDEMDETNWKKIDDIKAEDINIMGFTRGKKYMQIPIDKKAYNLALSASQKFKRFIA